MRNIYLIAILLLSLFVFVFPIDGVQELFVFISGAFFVLSVGFSLLYLTKERSLKKKLISAFADQMPSLEALEGTGFRLVVIGLSVLSAGILFQPFSSKAICYFSWIIYSLYLGLRLSGRISRHRLVYFLIVGSGLIVLSYLITIYAK